MERASIRLAWGMWGRSKISGNRDKNEPKGKSSGSDRRHWKRKTKGGRWASSNTKKTRWSVSESYHTWKATSPARRWPHTHLRAWSPKRRPGSGTGKRNASETRSPSRGWSRPGRAGLCMDQEMRRMRSGNTADACNWVREGIHAPSDLPRTWPKPSSCLQGETAVKGK